MIESYPDRPDRKNEEEGDRPWVRRTDRTVVEDVLQMEGARDPEFVRAVLKVFEESERDPFGREEKPVLQEGQQVFLLGNRRKDSGSAENRGKQFGRWVAEQVRGRAPLEEKSRLIPPVGFQPPYHFSVRSYTLNSEALVKAGFRSPREELVAFSGATACVKEAYPELLPGRDFGTLGYKLNGGFEGAAGFGFRHSAKGTVASHPVELGRDWVISETNGAFESDGFIITPQGKDGLLQVKVVGLSTYRRRR